ncbi:MAG: hypothetical protein JXR25_01655 [Pontiellaceae bacterium]|nr:hypothetical protein [Pontiellaceae bacterium]MBN2783505.1 hypothetical protein [Pontiellaceae bacterium]
MLVLVAGLACTAGAIKLRIKVSCRKWIATAQTAHPFPDNDLDSLLAYLDSDTHSQTDRNHVIWVIGQMRDSRALPTLEAYYTGGECDHDHAPCQHELDKAIRRCRSRE